MVSTCYDSELRHQTIRATALVQSRACPHCGHAISRLDAACMVIGGGTSYSVRIQLPDGSRTYVRVQDFNPHTMLWADE